MNIYVNVKSVGKRKPILAKVPYILPDNLGNLRELITETVKIEVEKYNSKPAEMQILPFLTEQEIEDQSQVGKIGFGDRYNGRKANAEKSIEIALQGFEDGLFKVVINDKEIETLESQVELKEDDILTFIRLTFLAGRSW